MQCLRNEINDIYKKNHIKYQFSSHDVTFFLVMANKNNIIVKYFIIVMKIENF